MERHIRFAAPAGGVAVALSLIVGVIAGVPLGTVLLRALFSGVTFAALVFGAMIAVERLLPELSPSHGQPTGESAADLEEPESTVAADGHAEAPGSRLNIVVEDDDPETEDDLVEEVEETVAADEQEVMSAAIEEEKDGSAVDIDDAMLDDMPDIGSMAKDFVSSDYEGDDSGDEVGFDAGFEGGSSGIGGSKQKAGDPRNGFPNEEIAKALRTTLQRDSG
jgi:hypothetical protein